MSFALHPTAHEHAAEPKRVLRGARRTPIATTPPILDSRGNVRTERDIPEDGDDVSGVREAWVLPTIHRGWGR